MYTFLRAHSFLLLAVVVSLGYMRCTPDDAEEGVPTEIGQEEGNGARKRNKQGCYDIQGKETIQIGSVSVDVHMPKGKYFGDLLVLPAWDANRGEWCRKSRLCIKAMKNGYRLIVPEMGKSIYSLGYFPETRADWAQAPDFNFLKDSLIPVLQEDYCLLKPRGNNFVLGISSGSRGVVRLCATYRDLFVAAAAISGDYDPSQMPGDNLYRGFLGSFETHPTRWSVQENLHLLSKQIRTPLFLAHGEKDAMVPFSQTKDFYNVLSRENPLLNTTLHLDPDRGHGYSFWNAEVQEVFEFFEGTQAKRPETP